MTWLGGLQAAGAEEEDEEELDESKYFDMRLRMMQKLEVRAGMGGLKTRRADHDNGVFYGVLESSLSFTQYHWNIMVVADTRWSTMNLRRRA
jgi:hypothetical protein